MLPYLVFDLQMEVKLPRSTFSIVNAPCPEAKVSLRISFSAAWDSIVAHKAATKRKIFVCFMTKLFFLLIV